MFTLTRTLRNQFSAVEKLVANASAGSIAARRFSAAESDAYEKAQPSDDPEVEVVFLDPLDVCHPDPSDAKQVAASVQFKVPKSFLNELHRGRELQMPAQTKGYGKDDKMVNAYVFGEQVEAFEYHFIGSHKSKSGYSCALLAADLAPMKRAQLREGDSGGDNKFLGTKLKPEAFGELCKRYREAHKHGENTSLGPFLTFMKILDSENASGVHVYCIRRAPEGSDVPEAVSATSSGQGGGSTNMGGSMSAPGKVQGAKISGLMVCQADRLTMGEH